MFPVALLFGLAVVAAVLGLGGLAAGAAGAARIVFVAAFALAVFTYLARPVED